jgi:hypothetical protein
MGSYYTYFISTLPTLQFGAQPPFSFQEFIKRCRSVITEGDIQELQKVALHALDEYRGSQLTLRRWLAIETALRSELAKIRAHRLQKEAHTFVRWQDYPEREIVRIATKVSRIPSPLEAEYLLDQYRWRVLEELSFGHYFDLDYLIIYARKLLMLERWQRIRGADSDKEINRAVAAVTKIEHAQQ